MKLPFIRGVLSLFFWPRYAKRISREHHVFLNAKAAMDDQKSDKPWADQQIENLRRSWIQSLLTVAFVLILAWAFGRLLASYVGQNVSIWQATIQYTGAGLLLWVTLGQGGWSIQSMEGETYAEKLDSWVYRVIHVIGTFLFVTGVSWSLASHA